MVFPLGFAENSIQLVPDGTLLLHVVIILVMVWVLNATLLKPISRILEEREKRTRGRREEARGILGDVSESLARYERSLRQARGEAYALAETERAAAMQERQQKLNEMRLHLSESVAQQKEAIQRQAETERGKLGAEAQSMAREIGSRLLNRPVSGAGMN
jgi:F-type H+-transporting ATPase subunit b